MKAVFNCILIASRSGVLNLFWPRLPKVKIKIGHLPPDRLNEKLLQYRTGGGCAGRRPKTDSPIFYWNLIFPGGQLTSPGPPPHLPWGGTPPRLRTPEVGVQKVKLVKQNYKAYSLIVLSSRPAANAIIL